MSLTRLPDSSHQPNPPTSPAPRKPWRPCLLLALFLFTLFSGKASVAIEIRQGVCPAPRQNVDGRPMLIRENSPCYTAELPSAGWWWIDLPVRVENPTHRFDQRPHLLEAHFEMLLTIDHAGTYRICPGDLSRGATIEPMSTFLPMAREGDPDEIELEVDPLVTEPIVVTLVSCDDPSKEGDPDELKLGMDP